MCDKGKEEDVMRRYHCSGCHKYFKSDGKVRNCTICGSPDIIEIESLEYVDNFRNVL